MSIEDDEREPERCSPDLATASPPSAERFAAAEALLLADMERDNRYWNGFVPGTSSVLGRIEVELNTRNPEFVQSLVDLVGGELVCFVLPPIGYDDLPPERAWWTLASEPAEDATSIDLLVEDMHEGCGHNPEGRILPALITYSADEISIEITLERLLWGRGYTCEGFGPAAFTVELDEPVNGRALTGGGR